MMDEAPVGAHCKWQSVTCYRRVHKLLNPFFYGYHHQIVSSVVVGSQLSCKSF